MSDVKFLRIQLIFVWVVVALLAFSIFDRYENEEILPVFALSIFNILISIYDACKENEHG